jgi:hypothetical protein
MERSSRYLSIHNSLYYNLLLSLSQSDVKAEAEVSSEISLFDSNSSESPILVRQSFNDPNDPLLNRDKYNENEGQFSNLSDGYESESDIVDYDGLYF